MQRIITAIILVPVVLLLVFYSPTQPLPIMGAIFVVSVLAMWEYLGLADAMGAKTPRVTVLIALALLLATIFRRSDLLEPVLGAVSLALLVVCLFRSPVNRVLPDTAYSILGLIYIGLPMGMLYLLSTRDNGPSLLMFLFLVVWSGDIAALYVGRAFGRRKLAPQLSPNKTWEGSVASVVGSVLVTLLLIWIAGALAERSVNALSYPGSVWRWLGLAVLLNVAAQAGDLVESAIKRGAGVKDSGHLLPGHGGMLDRVDALLLAAPVLWYAQLIQQSF
ncbi:MAG TPA: phosphatidate cytidylyltransferase [Acidobacteriaceae bacterium]|jgi:phosphatidate cytidylyltransferase|nr:phosphatidate cytidylyltransferase [Acidobacteriaceae bacterium]